MICRFRDFAEPTPTPEALFLMTNSPPLQLQPARSTDLQKKQASAARDQTAMEELFNALSHGLGLLLAIASLPILVYSAAQKGQAAAVVGASLFAGTAIVLYLISTLYHALPIGRAKAWFNRLDHAAIYLFIAGSYMPFLFGVLRGPGAGRCSAPSPPPPCWA